MQEYPGKTSGLGHTKSSGGKPLHRIAPLEDLLKRQRRIEVPVKVIEGLEIEKAGVLCPPLKLPLVTDGELVLEDQL